MNPVSAVLLLVAVIQSASGHCYDAQVAADQYFDDTFVCNEKIPYPAELIESDLNNLHNLDLLYFLDTATSCFNETGYFSDSHSVPGDYAYQCVCPSPRERIDAVYVEKNICFVVYPEKQNIQYAKCGGHCSFDYTTKIATASRGYFCVHQSFVQREFLVWCPSSIASAPNSPRGLISASGRVVRAAAGQRGGMYQPYGHFQRVSYTLPTLCSCRGYFCNDHAAAAAAVGGAVVTAVRG